ncbi:MAG: hypothetical protein AAF620_00175 [Bacteroidota bacterium]
MEAMKFDSEEEQYFAWWLDELQGRGFIKFYNRDIESFALSGPVTYEWIQKRQLKTKVKEVCKSTKILEGHRYTPDFEIFWDKRAEGVFYTNLNFLDNPKKMPYFIAQDDSSLVEIKSAFDMHNMTRLATINIKWVFEKFECYVQKAVVRPHVSKAGKLIPTSSLFVDTFTPKRYLMTDSGKQTRKIRFPVVMLDDFLKEPIEPLENI